MTTLSSITLASSFDPLIVGSSTGSSDGLVSTTGTFSAAPTNSDVSITSSSSPMVSKASSSPTNPESSSSANSSSSSASTSSSDSPTSSTPSSTLTPTSTITSTTTSTTPPSASTHPTTTIITTANSQLSTSFSPVATSLSTNANPSSSHRSTIVAVSAVSVVAFFVILASFVFGYTRYKRRKISAYIDKITEEQQAAHARARLLDGEDMDMGDNWSRHYRDNSVSGSGSGSWRGAAMPFHLPFSMRNMSTRSLSASIASQYTSDNQYSTPPHLFFRARGSETGSIFHEGVWPPPGEESKLVDPLKASSQVDLSRIVDDIMGSSNEQIRQGGGYTDMPIAASASQPQTRSPPKAQSCLLKQDPTYPPHTHNRTESTTSYIHSRSGSAASQTGLLPSPPPTAVQPKKSSPLAQNAAIFGSGEAGPRIAFGGGPSTIHWLTRSPKLPSGPG